jgi:hypothetical protein
MKKVLSVVLAVMMLASLSVCAFADVNPSVTTKAAPEVESVAVPGISGATAEAVSVADAEDEAVKKAIEDAIAAVSTEEGLADALAAAEVVLPEGAKAAVSDVFFFDVKDANGESVFKADGSVKAKVKLELPGNLLCVLQFVDGEWIEVEFVPDGNGGFALNVCHAGPIVFVYNTENG